MMSAPVSSPCAPADGCSDTPGSPAISPSHSCSSQSRRSAPCTFASSWYGWISASPGRSAMRSLILGLYFMVQEPSG